MYLWTYPGCLAGAWEWRQKDQDGGANSHLVWALAAFLENELENPQLTGLLSNETNNTV